jgi:NADP-dependent 3-hydroxy acid dehydrogenase YdfG
LPKVIAVLGAGPGLGLSMAHRFGREGFAVALVSRSDTRHSNYLASLAEAGITARGYVADVTDEDQVGAVLKRITAEVGEVDTVYFGPADLSAGSAILPLPEASADAVRVPFETITVPAARLGAAVLPRMLARGEGAVFFAGGLSGKYPMPMLGTLAPAAAALRMYALTLNAAVREQGVYVATLTIGGVIERGDIHRYVAERREFDFEAGLLNPDDIAEEAWTMYIERNRPEAEFTKLPIAQPR